MKLIFTFIAFFFISKINAAGTAIDSIPVKSFPALLTQPSQKNSAPIPFSCRARAIIPGNEPLVVIDGIAGEMDDFRKLKVSDIVSVDILKDATASAIYGCRAAQGVIIITTKTASTRKFIIKDFLSGANIPFATVSFISQKDKIVFTANDSGIVVADKLKPGVQYDITVSSAGYKTFTTGVKGKEQEILLERDIKENGNVIMIAYPVTRCGGCCHSSLCTISKAGEIIGLESKAAGIVKPVYPNPVQRNNVFNLELENSGDETMQLSIASLNGSIVLLQSQKVNKGLNHLSVTAEAKWSAGIYIVQLRNEKGRLIRQEKLMVQ
ncbi:MAG: T9SS type A sorting domain-containing protein [Bacteroidota bacterium]|nr:T9SS type A sorting domain-containing protein [Bacteroidota bacterium]